MPVDLFINLAQDYAERGYNHKFLKEVFSANREVQLSDLAPRPDEGHYPSEPHTLAIAAEPVQAE